MSHTTLVPDPTRRRAEVLLAELKAGRKEPSRRLRRRLDRCGDWKDLGTDEFLEVLIQTKTPQIFAESAVAGDGSDWTVEELGLLGDVSMAVPVTIFDNGAHHAPSAHEDPFRGELVFTPGALLRNGRGFMPADWEEITDGDGGLCELGYHGLYERRLLPVFQHINRVAAAKNRQAIVTIPGLGCGQFAGPFGGRLGTALQGVLEKLLLQHGPSFPAIRAVYYDPFSECENARREIHGISFMVRPLRKGNGGKSQLSQPVALGDEGDDFSDLMLFSLVAWDHVSWPGNDFFVGCRCTDDGVKAAATDSMAALTGVEGHYDSAAGMYLPPAPFTTWMEVVEKHGLELHLGC